MKNQTKKNNTINLAKVANKKNTEEIDDAIKSLTVFDLINACDDIRANGVIGYDSDDEMFVPLDMDAVHAVTGTADYMSLESVFASGFAKLIGGDRNCQPYTDFVHWYNVHTDVFIDNRNAGRDPGIAWQDIKYVALRDTVNAVCKALMDKYKEYIMTRQETIEAIAQKSAASIIEEAGAQNITTTQEVHDLIVKLLSDEKTYEDIEKGARLEANTRLYPVYKWRTNEILSTKDMTFDMLLEGGLDYGALQCLVGDGEEFGDLEEAIKSCIEDGWGASYAEAAEAEWREKEKEEEED